MSHWGPPTSRMSHSGRSNRGQLGGTASPAGQTPARPRQYRSPGGYFGGRRSAASPAVVLNESFRGCEVLKDSFKTFDWDTTHPSTGARTAKSADPTGQPPPVPGGVPKSSLSATPDETPGQAAALPSCPQGNPPVDNSEQLQQERQFL